MRDAAGRCSLRPCRFRRDRRGLAEERRGAGDRGHETVQPASGGMDGWGGHGNDAAVSGAAVMPGAASRERKGARRGSGMSMPRMPAATRATSRGGDGGAAASARCFHVPRVDGQRRAVSWSTSDDDVASGPVGRREGRGAMRDGYCRCSFCIKSHVDCALYVHRFSPPF